MEQEEPSGPGVGEALAGGGGSPRVTGGAPPEPEGVAEDIAASLGLEHLNAETLFSLSLAQWLGLLAIVLVAVASDFVAGRVLAIAARRHIHPSAERDQAETDKLIRSATRPLALCLGSALAFALIPLLALPENAHGVLRVATQVVATLAGIVAAYQIADLVADFGMRRAALTESKLDDLLVPLLRKAAKIAVVAFGLVFFAESLDLPIASLLAGLGIGGLAFAFAAKDTVENLFGSVAVILDRPFDAGDWVKIGETEGIVEDLGFRSTRVRTFANSLVTIPNATLVRATVDNLGRRTYRRFRTFLNITYGTHPDAVEAFCEGIRELVRAHPDTRKDFFEIHFNGFGPHSLDILVYIFFFVPDYSAELRARHNLCLDILRLAHELGIEFAFPTQTLHLTRAEASAGYDGRAPAAASQGFGVEAARRVLDPNITPGSVASAERGPSHSPQD